VSAVATTSVHYVLQFIRQDPFMTAVASDTHWPV